MSRNPNLCLGHGHVFPRPDGAKARCGGPALCADCRSDQAKADAGTYNQLTAEQIAQRKAAMDAHPDEPERWRPWLDDVGDDLFPETAIPPFGTPGNDATAVTVTVEVRIPLHHNDPPEVTL